MAGSRKITPEQYIASQLHLMFCEKEHTYDIRLLRGTHFVSECIWYLEDQIDPTWEQAEHRKYLDLTRRAIDNIRKEITKDGEGNCIEADFENG